MKSRVRFPPPALDPQLEVVACNWTGIALAFGYDEVAQFNTVVSCGATVEYGISIEGAFQPYWMASSIWAKYNTIGAWNSAAGHVGIC
jgi:hypothetical protein